MRSESDVLKVLCGTAPHAVKAFSSTRQANRMADARFPGIQRGAGSSPSPAANPQGQAHDRSFRPPQAVRRALRGSWGPPVALMPEEAPRSFPVGQGGRRRAAESLEMAGWQPLLRSLFLVRGVAEAILDEGEVRVRVGRLFEWAEVEGPVRDALAPFSPLP